MKLHFLTIEYTFYTSFPSFVTGYSSLAGSNDDFCPPIAFSILLK